MNNFFLNYFPFFSLTACYLCKKGDSLLCHNCLTKLPSSLSENKNTLILFTYKGKEIHTLLHEAKYKRIYRLYKPLIVSRESAVKTFCKENYIDYIIPIPSPQKRILLRGNNHTRSIAHILSALSGIKTGSFVTKKKYTKRQVLLRKHLREHNQKDSFSLVRNISLVGKNILLVDDITTTGSTFREVEKTLLGAGAQKVFFFAIAH